MKAMVLNTAGPVAYNSLRLVEIPRPEPGREEVLIKVKACGVCHTDLHIVEGEIPHMKLPIIPGHQVVGEIETLGPGAKRFVIGERVGVPWLHSSCGKCEFCKRGEELSLIHI